MLKAICSVLICYGLPTKAKNEDIPFSFKTCPADLPSPLCLSLYLCPIHNDSTLIAVGRVDLSPRPSALDVTVPIAYLAPSKLVLSSAT